MTIIGKFGMEIRETFLSFGREQKAIGNDQKYKLLKVECHPIMIFQSMPLVLFVKYMKLILRFNANLFLQSTF